MSKPVPIQDIEPNADAIEEWMRRRPSMALGKARPSLMRAIRLALENHIKSDDVYIYNSEGIIIAIRCCAIKKWCPLEGPKKVDFGDKHPAHTKAGRNHMCKIGYNAWFRSWRLLKKQKHELHEKLISGAIDEETYKQDLAYYEDMRQKDLADIQKLEVGYIEKQDCINYLKQEGLLD